MPKWDRHINNRLVSFLDSDPSPSLRSIRALAKVMSVSRGKIEYHVRQLLESGVLTRNSTDGLLRVTAPYRQLTLGLVFSQGNLIDITDRIGDSSRPFKPRSYYPIAIAAELPSDVSVEEILRAFTRVDARNLRVLHDTQDVAGARP